MTLIAALITKIDVVQVSDRLVSDRGTEFDPTANKQLIYLGPTWAVTMAYTGKAYISKLRPTNGCRSLDSEATSANRAGLGASVPGKPEVSRPVQFDARRADRLTGHAVW